MEPQQTRRRVGKGADAAGPALSCPDHLRKTVGKAAL
jgi:hypothetical protein